MAREVRHYAVTVPAGTAQASPLESDLAMPARIVRRVTLRFPPGPQGQVGVQLGSGGVQIVPWIAGTWLTGDNESIPFDLQGQIESGAWQLIAYNLGAYDHTVQVTMELDPPQLAGQAASGGPLLIAPGGA